MAAFRIKIFGLVQGVFFRVRAKELADQLKLTGWVKNTDDGSVEMHAEGTEDALKDLESWCHRGPPRAQVDSVIISEVQEKHLTSFDVIL